jgi:hypothetical protein
VPLLKLNDLAKTIRSKNAGINHITFDIIFPDSASYDIVRTSRALTRETVAVLFGVPLDRVTDFVEFAPARAIKFSLLRSSPCGGPGETDVFGCQQYGPLFDLEIPVPEAEQTV